MKEYLDLEASSDNNDTGFITYYLFYFFSMFIIAATTYVDSTDESPSTSRSTNHCPDVSTIYYLIFVLATTLAISFLCLIALVTLLVYEKRNLRAIAYSIHFNRNASTVTVNSV